MKIFTFLFHLLLTNTQSYIFSKPCNIYKKKYNDKIIKVFEPTNIDKKNLDSLLFFTGGNSLIPADIYTCFISSLVDYKYSVSVLPNDLQASYEYIKDIQNNYSSITPIAHSSGCVNAINTINNFYNIKKSIFLDPVDNSKLFNIFNNIQDEKLFYLKDLLIITAEKSYQWSLAPICFPFIPAFRLDIMKLLNLKSDLNIQYIEAEQHGHCDILDPMWADIMHQTISKGHYNRTYANLYSYHNWLAQQIHNFIYYDENDSNYTPYTLEQRADDSY